MSAEVGKNESDRDTANMVLNSGNDKTLLKLMREETTLLVLMVRIRNQQRKEVWEKKQAEKEEQERQASGQDPLFGLPIEEVEEHDEDTDL